MSTVSNGPLFRSRGTGNPGTQRAGTWCPRLTLSAFWNLTPIHSHVKKFFRACNRVDKRPYSGRSHLADHLVQAVVDRRRPEARAVEAELVQEGSERWTERAVRP